MSYHEFTAPSISEYHKSKFLEDFYQWLEKQGIDPTELDESRFEELVTNFAKDIYKTILSNKLLNYVAEKILNSSYLRKDQDDASVNNDADTISTTSSLDTANSFEVLIQKMQEVASNAEAALASTKKESSVQDNDSSSVEYPSDEETVFSVKSICTSGESTQVDSCNASQGSSATEQPTIDEEGAEVTLQEYKDLAENSRISSLKNKTPFSAKFITNSVKRIKETLNSLFVGIQKRVKKIASKLKNKLKQFSSRFSGKRNNDESTLGSDDSVSLNPNCDELCFFCEPNSCSGEEMNPSIDELLGCCSTDTDLNFYDGSNNSVRLPSLR